jgi:hypothetical protein
MNDVKKTIIVEVDPNTRLKIEKLATFNRRSISAQLRWMIDCDYERVFGKEPEPKKAEALQVDVPF